MKSLVILTFSCSLFYYSLSAQKHDNIWLFGYNASVPNAPGYGGTVIDFSTIPSDIYHEERDMFLNVTNGSICDSSGSLLFYSNGIYIANAIHEPMSNGLGINPGDYADNNINTGYILNQGVLSLPHPDPDSTHLYYLVHSNMEYPIGELILYASKLYYSKIDMSLENSLGSVVEKNQVIIDDIMEPGKVTACKHANGRDWWLFMRRYGSNEYHTILLSPSGFENRGVQIIGDSIFSPGLGQAIFSPDGRKFAELSLGGIEAGNFLNIYDFDRCTGLLSNPVQLTFADTAWAGGLAISPNSQFLYVSLYRHIYQYDLWASGIEATKDTVAVYDGFIIPPVFATRFFLAQLAPDGKIYISATNSVPYLHVINNPDLPGDSCDVCQHCIELPTWSAFSMPNFPNYRLGALEGSPCDTLRQPPTAAWSYEAQDSEVAFQDSSYHDIRAWHWDFGDGVTDTVPHPVHSYAAEGVYNVCLAVSNPRGADTLCREIQVLINNVAETESGILANISPNPVTNGVALLKLEALVRLENPQVILRDALGREVLREPLSVVAGKVQQELKVGHLAVGVYFCSVEDEGSVVWQGKVVKQ
ncbi:MAG: PKD domain-containing protein [Saprospiraceae bacterium]